MRVFPIHRERAANFDLAAFWCESEDEARILMHRASGQTWRVEKRSYYESW